MTKPTISIGNATELLASWQKAQSAGERRPIPMKTAWLLTPYETMEEAKSALFAYTELKYGIDYVVEPNDTVKMNNRCFKYLCRTQLGLSARRPTS